MTDREMIVKIEATICRLRDMGLPTDSVERFFDVGAWLIAFEGLESSIMRNSVDDIDVIGDCEELSRYFN